MIARVVDIENKFQRSQSFRIETLDCTLKIVPGGFDDASPLERVLHMLVERHVSHDKELELVNEVRRGLVYVAFADSVRSDSSQRSNVGFNSQLKKHVWSTLIGRIMPI